MSGRLSVAAELMGLLLLLFVDLSMLNGTITVAYTDAEALPSVHLKFTADFWRFFISNSALLSTVVECGFSKLVDY